VDEQSADTDQIAGMQDARHCVVQQRAPQVLTLTALVHSKAPEQDNGHRLVDGKTASDSGGHVTWHDRTRGERVVARNIVVGLLGGDEHARSTAAMALERVFTQPLIE